MVYVSDHICVSVRIIRIYIYTYVYIYMHIITYLYVCIRLYSMDTLVPKTAELHSRNHVTIPDDMQSLVALQEGSHV